MRRKWSLPRSRAVSVLLWAAFPLDVILFLWNGVTALLAAHLIVWLIGWRCSS